MKIHLTKTQRGHVIDILTVLLESKGLLRYKRREFRRIIEKLGATVPNLKPSYVQEIRLVVKFGIDLIANAEATLAKNPETPKERADELRTKRLVLEEILIAMPLGGARATR